MNPSARLNELHLAVSEVDALAAITLDWFDEQNWILADPVILDRVVLMLGMLARAAMGAASKMCLYEAALMDAQSAPGVLCEFPEELSSKDASLNARTTVSIPTMPSPTDLPTKCSELNLAISELDVLATVVANWFQEQELLDVDPLIVARLNLMLCVIARVATVAASKMVSYETSLADEQPASTAGWDFPEDTPAESRAE